MARSKFGGSAADIAFQRSGPFVAFARPQVLTAWTAAHGGIQHTDLLDANGQPTSAITMVEVGQVPLFWGPDGVEELWIDDGDGVRALMVTQGRAGTPGEDGEDGRSAYQAWLDAGNTGTEADFLDSLRSEVPGPPGGGGWMVDPLDSDVLVVTPGDQVHIDPDDSDVLVVTA